MATPVDGVDVFQAMQPVGHLSKVEGLVVATNSASGQARTMQAGDSVYSDDVVTPKSGGTGVVVMNSGQEVVVLGESDFNFNVGSDAVSFLGDLGGVSYLLDVSLFNEGVSGSQTAGVATTADTAQSAFDISGIEGNPAFPTTSGISLDIGGESSFGAGSETLTLGRGAVSDDVASNESTTVGDAIGARETRNVEAQVVGTTESQGDSSSASAAPPSEAPAMDLDASSGGIDFATTFIAENNTAVSITNSDATLSDLDSATLDSLTISITNLSDGAFESLGADVSGTSIGMSYDSATGVLTLSGVDSVSNYQQVLQTVTYNNTSETPDASSRAITFIANDGSTDSAIATASVTMLTSDDSLFTPTISGTAGDDVITGGKGKDVLVGYGGDDTLEGGKGKDTIAGGDGADVLEGGRGADVLHGQFGDDTLDGGKGKDTLIGGFGDDSLTGGKGADTFGYTSLLTDGNDTILDFGSGNDKVELGDALTASGKTDSDVVLTQSGDDVVLTVNGFSTFSVTFTGHVLADFDAPGSAGFGVVTLA